MEGYKHLGDLSAVEPWHSRWMCCYDCKLSWEGCWDNFMCPKCGAGELPTSESAKLPPGFSTPVEASARGTA